MMHIPDKYRDRYDNLARSHPWMREMRDETETIGDLIEKRRCKHYHADKHYCDIHETRIKALTAERDGEEFEEDVPSEQFDETLVDVMALRETIASLEEADREIIRLRYFAGRTQSYVASVMGMTQVQVSRRERRILDRMRGQLLK